MTNIERAAEEFLIRLTTRTEAMRAAWVVDDATYPDALERHLAWFTRERNIAAAGLAMTIVDLFQRNVQALEACRALRERLRRGEAVEPAELARGVEDALGELARVQKKLGWGVERHAELRGALTGMLV